MCVSFLSSSKYQLAAEAAVADFESRIAQFPPLDDKPINVDDVVVTVAPLHDQ